MCFNFVFSKINNNLFQQAKLLFKNLYNDTSIFSEAMISLKDFCSQISSGGTPSRDNMEYWNSNNYNWLKNGEIKNNIIFDTEEYISINGLKNSSAKLIPENSVSMAMYCVSDIQVSFNCIPLSTNQAVLNFQTDSFLKSCVIYYLLATFGNNLTTRANGSAQQNLSKDTIQTYKFKTPVLQNVFFEYLVANMNERISIAKEIHSLNQLKLSLIEGTSKQ